MTHYYNVNQLRSGLKILLNHEPYLVLNNQFVKPGKGQPFNRIRLKKITSGKIVDKIFKSNENCISANIHEVIAKTIYQNTNHWYFMKKKNFEQFYVKKTILGENNRWIIEQIECTVTFWNQNPICINLPRFINIKVLDTRNQSKKDTSQSSNKSIILITGAVIKAPLFVQKDDIIKIDTRTGEYVSRKNKK
ncbi:elongation factor EF-P [Wigglesworthia glossinidia endosymbiont of Glossina morsitans morsitans (Yale colony)]|uniref:Elongation factor P n=1 Tax=Wigglesworthia glossinidia endosymbiont of Glossina morsitans morsitans (Yale colony) TaxID=1142511 RepID=H6Q530_WIGGL|nr:elongation factor P [Wigglesworthia glossinidia]AFA41313.1 elongation factor EF-P [Wigglesworthia glossinidia endosymbiont of Glossina morsitans morsitans (Yale colony)]